MKNTIEEADEVFAALEGIPEPLIFLYPNADAGSRELIARAENVSKRRRSRVLVNLEHRTYLSLLNNVGALVGNSSSGIIESTSLEVPAVNIGIRQRGREHPPTSLMFLPNERPSKGQSGGRSSKFRQSIRGLKNPYGEGRASEIVSRVLIKAPLGEKLLFKHATCYDYSHSAGEAGNHRD